jgi:AcrR family transcriptional regulator
VRIVQLVAGTADTEVSWGAKGTRTRQALLQHAIRRFAAEGFRGTSVSDVARDARLTPAAAYAYFVNKEALFRAAVDADSAALIAEALPDVAAGVLERNWAAMLGAFLGAMDRHPLARRVLSGLEPDHTERLVDIPALAELRAEIAEQLRAGQLRGNVRADIDPTVIASGLETVVVAILIALFQTGVSAVGDRTEGVVALLDAAVRTPRP